MDTFAPNARKPTFIKETLLKLKAPHALNVGDFNTPILLSELIRKHILNKDTVKLSEVLDQMDLTDIYRTFHTKGKEYTFFSAPHGTFYKIDHITSLNTSQQT